MNFKIEKNIPITKHSKKARFDDLIFNMAIGNSILLNTYSDVDYLRQSAYRQNKKVASRTVWDNGRSSFRVWRIK